MLLSRYKDFKQMPISMPREIYDTLSPHGKKMCAEIVAPPGEELNVKYVEDVIQIRLVWFNINDYHVYRASLIYFLISF